MKSVIYDLLNHEKWIEFLNFKKNQTSAIKSEIKYLEQYILERKYINIATKIVNNTYVFSIPKKHSINKLNKKEKRIVYSYNEDEMMILKFISYLVSIKYDNKYYDNLYSFRKNISIKQAFYKIINTNNIDNLYGYKIDIHNYFNSVDIDILLPKLKIFLNDNLLFKVLKNILIDKRVIENNIIKYENKGIMAGIPISSFLANIYLLEVDKYFYENNILYVRYSDDIILFSNKERINELKNLLDEKIFSLKLTINEDKRKLINPNEKWEFLGFSYKNKIIDISNSTKRKIKLKIRKSARKIRRWMLNNNKNYEKALFIMNKKFNYKFYDNILPNELTWSKWYFNIINTTISLKEIDKYFQQYLRYIITGKFNKKNYKISYNILKKYGYRPLVSEFYKKT